MRDKSKREILLDKLVRLQLEEKSVLRNLNMYYCDKNIKDKLFVKLKKVKKEIDKVKFKLRIEREINKNDKNYNSSKS